MSKAMPTQSQSVVPAAFQHQPDLRALPILPSIPPSHMTFPVTDDTFHPHLQPGEFALIDIRDHQPENGELFLIAYCTSYLTGPGITYRLCQPLSRVEWERPDGVWTKLPGAGEAHTLWVARHGMRRGCYSDGDFTTDYLAEKLVGRVIGIYVPVIGEARAAKEARS